MKMMYILLLGCLVNVQAADLTINISNITVKQGSLKIALYNEAKDFPEGLGRFQGQELSPSKEKLSVQFKELPPGRYAIAVMQDYNGNGMLDRNFFGIPTEAYGFSQRKEGETAPPSFEQASFAIDNGNKTLDIELVK